MHLSERHPPATPTDTNAAQHADDHYLPLKNAIPAWLGSASSSRREALKGARVTLPASFKAVPLGQHELMKSLGAAHIAAQSQVDKSLEHLQDAAAFAEPLLKAELKSCFNLDLDVRNTFVRLYIPATTPWFSIRTGARVWSISLLDAALHNFEESETRDNAFESDSTYTTAPTANGQFEPLPDIKARLSIPAFTQLCRRLDIGAKYKASLEDNLGYSDPMVASVLRSKLDASEKAAMKAALQWARMNRDVSESAARLVEALLDGIKGIHINGAPVLCHDVTMLCAPLTGIVVFAPDLYMTRSIARVVAYVPDDPEHPFKEYTSPLEMIVELTRQLRSKDYQGFFARFVNHEQRGHFFNTLNSRLSEIKWHPHEPGSSLPAWREAPVERPDLQTALTPFHDDLWQHLHQAKLNKIFNDARVIAVPTAWVDQRARWAFWDSVVNILSTIAQTAALIVAPFVPVLGEAMMAYMAYQMLDETFEGIVEWAQGRTTEAMEHLMGTVESMIQLGMFAVGGAIGAAEFRKVLPKEVVAFIDRFKPVKMPTGETRYWEPDLQRYQHPLRPDAESQPDALGLHSHQDKRLLPLEDAHYSVKQSTTPGQYRIEHPSRPDAYQPVVRHNGEGAWHTELEQPLQWDGETALRRLGPAVETFSPAVRETILQISGSSEDALRKMHVNQEKIPPLLADSIQRFKIDQQLQRFIDQLDSDVADRFLRADPVTQLQLLSEHGRWPSTQRLRLLDRQGKLLWQSSADESLPVTQLRQDSLINGDLLKTLLNSLDEAQIKLLLDEPFAVTPSLDARSQTLRQQVAGLAKAHRSTLFESRYQALQHNDDPLAAQLQAQAPALPATLTRELLDTATGSELLQINEGRLPPRQQELLQLASQEVRVTRAYEGLHLDSINNPDSDVLALHSLKLLPGWSGDVRIEIRDGRYEGPVLASVGSEEAPAQKVLVRHDDGRYQPYDDRGQELHSLGDFYSSLLQALPDSERQSLNLQIGQDQALKTAIRERTPERHEVRTVIAEPPIQPPAVDTLRLLGADGYPRLGTPPPDDALMRATEEIRILYPRMSDPNVQSLAHNMLASPSGWRAEMVRLQNDHLQLQNELHVWANNPPAVHPETGLPLTSIEKRAEIQNRRLLRQELLSGWRRENARALDHRGVASGHALCLTQRIMGDLPVLSADFGHITELTIDGITTSDSLDGFLQSFRQLKNLDARNLNVPNLPQALTSMPALRELRMRNCAVGMTPASESVLASMPQLTLLDLQGNALGLPPDLHTLPSLRYVNLSKTGIHTVPDGVLEHPSLISGQFNGNNITHIPDSFFNLAASLSDGYTFADNPLSATSRERVKSFFQSTGTHYGVRPDPQDLQRTTRLFPALDDEQATQVLYRLPGTLAEGRGQLSRWETELDRLDLELNQWTNQALSTDPATGEALSLKAQERELEARRSFAQQMRDFWSLRTGVNRAEGFNATAGFSGDMPVLSANFEHVSRINVSGNPNISGTLAFVQSFPNLTTLRLRNFDLEPLALAETTLPALNELELKNCGVTLTPENQAALLSLNNLRTLDLSDNQLGTFPDLNLLPELTYIDLSNNGLTVAPEGLISHPKLRTAVLTGNRIENLPDALFDLPAERSDGIYLSDNPLSPTSRNKIKDYFRTHGNDFEVRADNQDIALARQLFPALDQQEASDLIYSLPGNLAEGRRHLVRWREDLEKMLRDLTRWAGETPTTHPVTGQVLSADELQAQTRARTEFKRALEALWRLRTRETATRGVFFATDLRFFGEMPRLTADFSHVATLKLTGNAAISDPGPFVERFSNLQALKLKAFALNEVPAFVGRLQQLNELQLSHCAVTLTPAGQDVLNSLPALTLLDLSANPLQVAPDLRTLPAIRDVFLINTGLTALPEGLAEHPPLESIYLNNNAINDLPDDFFSLDPQRAKGVQLTGNPLSPKVRERIKTYYAAHGHHFQVMPDPADIAKARSLFPRLNDYSATNMIYRLPGTLHDGKVQLLRWDAEISQMLSDLSTWREQIPVNNPATGQLWTGEQRAAQLVTREHFGEQLEKLWRSRSAKDSALRLNTFEADATFAGELPELSADFSHITHLNLQGNSGLSVPDSFLSSFSGLQGLELEGFTLGRIPRPLNGMRSLKTLMMSGCQITLDAAGQTTLSGLTRLHALDLFNNPLRTAPDVSALKELTFLDFTGTQIDSLPPGLEQLPQLKTALLSDNNIRELPDDLTLYAGRGVDMSANPLSDVSRERVKACFQLKADHFNVSAEPADIEIVQTLYPQLTAFQANDLLYRLPGTFAEGRSELLRRHTEFTTLKNELDNWVSGAAQDGRTDDALEHEITNRNAFKEHLLQRLREMPTELMRSELDCDLSFSGELPVLNGRFDYVKALQLTSTATVPPKVDRLLQIFPKLQNLTIRDYHLNEIPAAVFALNGLETLELPACRIALTRQTAHDLGAMSKLNLLDLSNNPLRMMPDLRNLRECRSLHLRNTGLREVPPGLLDLPHLGYADLSNNAITELPPQLHLEPIGRNASLDFSGNLLNPESQQRLQAYQAANEIRLMQERVRTVNLHQALDDFEDSDFSDGEPRPDSDR
ncbi:MAG TPA: DUF6543 domain-containing protein [Pseudomonas sp.]|uniref:dermonecrotic toxin domain-containing protein n=1 Tax=Pseudomonas sp. TaxID=306 RepID=UPI002C14E998|nr:DUF6543 domain-containing protein [Pseudomonas sp.]HWH86807.1 DUF6543 domain-containing protein [Pseudomonas sp.]